MKTFEFVFKADEPSGEDVEVFVSVNGIHLGKLLMIIEEWEHLRPMLLEGNKLYMEKEATIVIDERSSVHAYLEGVNG